MRDSCFERMNMRRCIILAVVAVLSLVTKAQTLTKLDIGLKGFVQTGKVSTEGKECIDGVESKVRSMLTTPDSVVVNAIMEDGATLPVDRLTELGIRIDDRNGKFVCMVVPTPMIAKLDSIDGFVSFEQNRKCVLMNKTSQQAMKVNMVQNESTAQAQGLRQAYTGKGVIVGVFDSGIDFNHNNFRNPSTKQTRILEARIYGNDTKATPSTIASTSSQIDALTTDNTSESHGTHTASTAAGSYTGSYINTNSKVNYYGIKGVANEADLVLCGTAALYDNKQQNALTRMDEIATEKGEPLVVNLSLGSCGDWADGKSSICQFYDQFTDYGNKPGRIVCVSAGNEGSSKFTIYKELNSANNHTIQTFLPVSTLDGKTFFIPRLYIYCDDATTVQLSIIQYNSEYKVLNTITNSTLSSYMVYGKYSAHNNRYAKSLNTGSNIWYYTANADDHWAIKLKSASNKDCKVRVYAYYYDSGSFSECDMTSNGRDGFVDGDGSSTISSLACTNSVLSVGAWQKRTDFSSYNGNNYSYNFDSENDYIAQFSSWIDSDDNGISRPDFAAPGTAVVSGINSYDETCWSDGSALSSEVCGKATTDYLSGHTSLCGAKCGTSMSCPNAVGVIALWLQADPTLTVNRIREIIKATADNDAMTASQATRFGAGKLNALAGLKMIEEATGIMHVEGTPEQQYTIYTLSGQRAEKPSHGIYIVNGQKVVLP